MLMYSVAAVLWGFTMIHTMIVIAATSVTSSQQSSHHRFTKKENRRLPVPVIFDTDYGPFIDDGMFPS